MDSSGSGAAINRGREEAHTSGEAKFDVCTTGKACPACLWVSPSLDLRGSKFPQASDEMDVLDGHKLSAPADSTTTGDSLLRTV